MKVPQNKTMTVVMYNPLCESAQFISVNLGVKENATRKVIKP